MKPTTKPGAGALRLCYAVGLATQVRVGRWAPIVDVVALLSAADQDAQRALLEAAIAADLVKLSGPFDDAHSIALTATGLDDCTAAATAPERKKARHRSRDRGGQLREETPSALSPARALGRTDEEAEQRAERSAPNAGFFSGFRRSHRQPRLHGS